MSKKVISTSSQSLRLSATLLFTGILFSFLAGFLHPGHAYANDHIAVFAENAGSSDWTAVHLGQFAGMAVLIAGLIVLYFALDIQSGTALEIKGKHEDIRKPGVCFPLAQPFVAHNFSLE